jgi:hypothetical protein
LAYSAVDPLTSPIIGLAQCLFAISLEFPVLRV